MNYGNGGIIINNPSSGGGMPSPPFALNSADNGLSVDTVTGRIVLGESGFTGVSKLLGDRVIPLDGHSLIFAGAAVPDDLVTINDQGNWQFLSQSGTRAQMRACDPLGNTFFLIDSINAEYQIGDANGQFNGNAFVINDGANVSSIISGGFTYLEIDNNNALYKFGDIQGAIGDNYLEVNPTINRISAYINAINDPNNAAFQVADLSDNPFIYVGATSVTMGDINGVLSSTRLAMTTDPTVEAFFDLLGGASNHYIYIDQQPGFERCIFGNIGPGTPNPLDVFMISGTSPGNASILIANAPVYEATLTDTALRTQGAGDVVFQMSDSSEAFDLSSNFGSMLNLDGVNQRMRMGDINSNINGALIEVDVANNTIFLRNDTNTVGLWMNGNPGFTGTVAVPTSITVDNGIVVAVS